jgi:hypothetical protein
MTSWSDRDVPAGGKADSSHTLAGLQGQAFLDAWKKTRADQAAEGRRRARHRKPPRRIAGMIRWQPPGGDDAA